MLLYTAFCFIWKYENKGNLDFYSGVIQEPIILINLSTQPHHDDERWN